MAPITLRTAVTGVPEEVTLSDGTVAIKDMGTHRVRERDLLRRPTDVEGDVFLFQTIEPISGPRPKAESGFTLLCEVVVPAMT